MPHCAAALISVAAIMPQAMVSGKARRRQSCASFGQSIFRKAEWSQPTLAR
jgi:hypothetical protein